MSARLSPAASLLRNSKLFALPPQIALPPAPPSSDTVSQSNTATSVYPQYAAIRTLPQSGSEGDWGFKRPLPLKTTKTTSNPVVRLVRGIDTPEHVADFEPAGDHVLTLRKFQELNHAIRHDLPGSAKRVRNTDRQGLSVFRGTHDNTADLSKTAPVNAPPSGVWPNVDPEDVFNALPKDLQQNQIRAEEARKAEAEAETGDSDTSGLQALQNVRKPVRREQRRWRYDGPSLTQITGMQFDAYVHGLGEREKRMLNQRIKAQIKQERLAKAREEGQMDQQQQEKEPSEQEIKDYLRYLRQNPRKFGPMIAEILDLPEAAVGAKGMPSSWEYGRTTLASEQWLESGPPRTHPSAGLSYLTSNQLADNDPNYGPQLKPRAALARVVKSRTVPNNRSVDRQTTWGVAGFIAVQSGNEGFMSKNTNPPPPGGKTAVEVLPSHVDTDGSLQLRFERPASGIYTVQDNKIYFERELNERERAGAIEAARWRTPSAPRFSNVDSSQTTQPRQREYVESSPDIDDMLRQGPSRSRPLR